MSRQEGILIGYKLTTNNGLEFSFKENEKETMRKTADENGGGGWYEIREYDCEECGDKTTSIYSCRKETISISTTLDGKFVCKKCFDKIDNENKSFWNSVFEKQDKIMEQIKEIGVDVCRINYSYYNDGRDEKETRDKIGKYMIDNGMYHLYTGDYCSAVIQKFRWGNGCLCDVPVEFANKIQEQFPFVTTDLFLHHIGKTDLRQFNKGDRVEVGTQTILGNAKNKYTVHLVNEDYIVVMKTSRSKQGYKYKAGDCVNITKVA